MKKKGTYPPDFVTVQIDFYKKQVEFYQEKLNEYCDLARRFVEGEFDDICPEK